MRNNKSRKILIGAIMLSMTALNSACVSGPFQQQIPETQWVVDNNGNKQKISINASTNENSISLIGQGIESYYNKNFSDLKDKDLGKLQGLIFTDAQTNEEAGKILDEFYKSKAGIYDGIYYGEMSDRAILTNIRHVFSQGITIIGRDKMKIPANSVSVKGLNAFIKSDEVPEEFSKSLTLTDKGIPLFKINGEWKIDAVAIAKHYGYYEKE